MRVSRVPSKVRVAIVYKNFAIHAGISHIGLGVAAINNAKVLEKHGIKCDVIPANTITDIQNAITQASKQNIPFTHMVISAAWLKSTDLRGLCGSNPFIEFYVNCHSNVGFLQADPNGIALIRQYVDLEQGSQNFHMAGNSKKFVVWLKEAYQAPCSYMPNMYFLDYSQKSFRPTFTGSGTLRIGAFGAIRPQKNVITACGAAIILANTFKTDTEFWVNGGRSEGGGTTIVNAIKQMISGIPNIKLQEYNWSSWSAFRDTVRSMNLLLQVSYTESFNMVTADGIAEGIPSVVSDAIDWVPNDWHAHFDNSDDVARVGRKLLLDRYAASDGLKALEQHNNESYGAWTTALSIKDCSGYRAIDQDPFIL